MSNVHSSVAQSAGPGKKSKRRATERGFTLVELLVVLVILGLIATLAAPRVLNYLGGAKTDTAKLQIERLATALDLYRLQVGDYPDESFGLRALIEQPSNVDRWNGPYVTKSEAIQDPWGRPYVYRYPGDNGEFDLYSLGRDGQEGGDGEDADITSW